MASGILRTSLFILNYILDRSPSTLVLINIIMVRIAVFLSNNEQIFLLLFEIMISQVCKPFGTLQCLKSSLKSANSWSSAAVFSYLFVLLARRSQRMSLRMAPSIHDQGPLLPGLSENTNWCLKVNIQPKKIFALFSFLWLLSSSILLSLFDTQIMNCLPRHKNLSLF